MYIYISSSKRHHPPSPPQILNRQKRLVEHPRHGFKPTTSPQGIYLSPYKSNNNPAAATSTNSSSHRHPQADINQGERGKEATVTRSSAQGRQWWAYGIAGLAVGATGVAALPTTGDGVGAGGGQVAVVRTCAAFVALPEVAVWIGHVDLGGPNRRALFMAS
jgi:hypothetical protein